MKITEIISAKYPQKRSLATLFCVALSMLCLFTEIISFSIHAGAKNDTDSVIPSSADTDYISTEPIALTDYSFAEIRNISNDILYQKMSILGQNSLQTLMDNDFCSNAINGNIQTYVQALIRNPYLNPNLSAYTAALANALNQSVSAGDNIYPTSVQKAVITLCECQKYISDEPFTLDTLLSDEAIDLALNETIGQKGIMSYIYGLKMLETLDSADIHADASHSKEEIILTLISMQLSDGGYALIGKSGDTDVTAMALQALSGVYRELSSASGHDPAIASDSSVTSQSISSYSFSEAECNKIISSIEASIAFLRSIQLSDGDYASSGNACSESTAQVIIAVSDLGLSYNDFIKNDHSLLDGLLIYRMSDGSFTHTSSPAVSNDMASAQAFEALCAYTYSVAASSQDIVTPETNLFAENYINPGSQTSAEDSITDNSSSISVSSNTIDSATDDNASSSVSTHDSHVTSHTAGIHNIKFLLYIAIFALLLIVIAIFTISYKRNKNRKKYISQFISAVVVALLAGIIVFSINIQSKQDYETAQSDIIFAVPGEGIISVTYSIDSSTVTKNSDAAIYPAQTLCVAENSTVFDVLREVCRLNGIQLDYESNSIYGTAYIKGINSLYENDYGDLSGWMYRVNGDFPSVGCGYLVLSDGDCVEWLYTTNLGEDLKND